MTEAINTKLRLTGIAGALALAATIFTASASFAGERGDRWERDGSSRIELHYDRDRQVQRHRRAALTGTPIIVMTAGPTVTVATAATAMIIP
jgi:hypothetical protein